MAAVGESEDNKRHQKFILPVVSSPSNFGPSSRHGFPSEPATPKSSVLVQGRAGGPVDRYRVASKKLCRVASVFGWAAVVIGAGETALGAVVFSKWRREGGWWAGVLAVMLGMAGTGITADTPVGTPLVTRLVFLGVASLITSLVTALALDGAKWLSIKDVEMCASDVRSVCQECTCSSSNLLWDMCFPPLNGSCGGIESAAAPLLASSVVLLALALVSAVLLATGIKVKFLGGGVEVGGEEARPNPAKTPGKRRAPYKCVDGAEPPTPADVLQRRRRQREQQQQEEEGRTLEEVEEAAGGEEERKESDTAPTAKREFLTGAEPWAVGYVDRLAGGGNKKRRDELNSNPGKKDQGDGEDVSQ
ncbi:unnamed protein product [Ectocarpus sp. 6 AP-2014]